MAAIDTALLLRSVGNESTVLLHDGPLKDSPGGVLNALSERAHNYRYGGFQEEPFADVPYLEDLRVSQEAWRFI